MERFIGYLAHNFLPRLARENPTTIADLNDAVAAWLTDVDARQIGGLRSTRRERFAEEKPHMLAWIPQAAPDVRHSEELVVSREGMITWQTNRYTVPAELIGELVTLKEDTLTGEADIVHDGVIVRSVTLCAAGSRTVDHREADRRSFQARWERENKCNKPAEPETLPDAETQLLWRLYATMVEIRHPAAYDKIAEHSA